jgi:hypothetical protein
MTMIICFNCYKNIINSIYYAQDHAFCTNSCRTFFITNKYTNTIVNNYKHRHDTSGNIFIKLNDNYIELGATATDLLNITLSYIISGDVNTSLVGIYTLTYTVTNTKLN